MTVADLIAKLHEMPQDALVVVYQPHNERDNLVVAEMVDSRKAGYWPSADDPSVVCISA